MQQLKKQNPGGVLVGSGKLATELERLELIDEYNFLIHPVISGHGPTLYQDGLPASRLLKLLSVHAMDNGVLALRYQRA